MRGNAKSAAETHKVVGNKIEKAGGSTLRGQN